MPDDPSRIARMYRKLSPEEDPARPRRAVPTTWVVALVAVLMLALPLGVFGSIVAPATTGPTPTSPRFA